MIMILKLHGFLNLMRITKKYLITKKIINNNQDDVVENDLYSIAAGITTQNRESNPTNFAWESNKNSKIQESDYKSKYVWTTVERPVKFIPKDEGVVNISSENTSEDWISEYDTSFIPKK